MVIGQSVAMLDAVERVSGSVQYALNVELPGMLIGRILRSPHPHARLVRISTAIAEKLPGVFAVVTQEDVVDRSRLDPFYGPVVRDQPILAIDRVRYVGEPVAAVAAVDRETAEQALELIEVEYEPLEAVVELKAAMELDAPRVLEEGNVVRHFDIHHGDLEAGFSQADYVFEDEYRCSSIHAVPMEPHVCTAQVQHGRITVWSSTQTPHFIRSELAAIFKLPLTQVRVIVHQLGGGFGAKAWPRIEPLTALLAWKAGGRPVQLLLSRTEDFLINRRSPAMIRLKSGVMRDGTLVAQEVTCVLEKGAYVEKGPSVAQSAANCATGAYRIPNKRIMGYSVFTNLPPTGPIRAPGVAQGVWAGESHMDAIARRLGIDPLILRRKNLARNGDRFIAGGLLEGLHFTELLDEAARTMGWDERSAIGLKGSGDTRVVDGTSDGSASHVSNETPDENRSTVRRGRGVALTLKTTKTPTMGSAVCRLNADGSLDVISSVVEMGQGVSTAMAQVAADALELPLERVRVSEPDTDVTPYDQGTTASRTTYVMGNAVRLAAAEVRRQLTDLAAGQMEISAEDVVLEQGHISARGVPDPSLSYGQVVQTARQGNILGHGTFLSEASLDPVSGKPGAADHWHQGLGAAEVEVDTETGKVRLLRYHTGVFAGRAINPRQCELQTEGSLTFGLGQALIEELAFDGGQMVNPNLGDYMLPSIKDLPSTITLHLLEEPGLDDFHGVGESTLPAAIAAISNAVSAAIGRPLHELPITPERVLRALQDCADERVEA